MAKETAKTVKAPKESKEVEHKEEPVKASNDQDNIIAQLQAQINLLTQMVTNSARPAENVTKPNRMIRFINLKDCTVVLKASKDSPAWKIEGQYNYLELPEREAHNIAIYMSKFLRKGTVYIDDAEFVQDNGLDAYYATLLSDKDLKELLDMGAAKVVEIYKNVNDNQKEIIIDLVKKNRRAGRKVDNNILVELSQLSGKDLVNLTED